MIIRPSARILALVITLFSIFPARLAAQIDVFVSNSASQLASQLEGEGVSIANAQLNCPNGAVGTFISHNGSISLDSGIILSTGLIQDAKGPNISSSTQTGFGQPGNSQLNSIIAPLTSYDACVLEFDVKSICDSVVIEYVFASEEYNEYVCSPTNDAFAFFVSGPGITGVQNIATLQGSSNMISVNSVNNGSVGQFGNVNTPGCILSNSSLYVDNTAGADLEYDGFTIPLLAKMRVIPCSTYHVEIVIADVSDDLYDSGIFMSAKGVKCKTKPVTVEAKANSQNFQTAIEGCIDGSFIFRRKHNFANSQNINYTVTGSATQGVDFIFPPGPPLAFQPGDSTAVLNISALYDRIPETPESVQIILTQVQCGLVYHDTATLFIVDGAVANAGPDREMCVNDTLQLMLTGSSASHYNWSPGTGLSATHIANPLANIGSPGVYTYYAGLTDFRGCTAYDTLNITVYDLPTASFIFDRTEKCLGDTCFVTYTGTPGLHQFNWIAYGGSVFPSMSTPATQVLWNSPGWKTLGLTVIDGNGCRSETYFDSTFLNTSPDISVGGNDPVCGLNDGFAYVSIQNGAAPFNYFWNTLPAQYTDTIYHLSAGQYIVEVEDSLGCRDRDTIVLSNQQGISLAFQVDSVSCFGDSSGSIFVNATGGTGTYTYQLDNFLPASSSTFLNLTGGFHTITVSDSNGCTETDSIQIGEPAPVEVTFFARQPTCPGDHDGSLRAMISGGVGNYSLTWQSGITSATLVNLPKGIYSLTVVDSSFNMAGDTTLCMVRDTFNLEDPDSLSLTIQVIDESCPGSWNGGATAFVSGGIAPYSYQWVNVSGVDTLQQITYQTSGSYRLLVTDSNGCTVGDSLMIQSMYPPLDFLVQSTNISCAGANDGTLGVIMNNGMPPYTYGWSFGTPSSSDSVSGMSPGVYYVTVTDSTGCVGSDSAIIQEPSQLRGDVTIQHVRCHGDSSAQAFLSITGGVGDYTHQWLHDTSSSYLLTGLSAGEYGVIIQDSNGCTEALNFLIWEPDSILLEVNTTEQPCSTSTSMGTATVQAVGGTGAFRYEWSTIPAQMTSTASGLPPGTYVCMVEDANGCKAQIEARIDREAGPVADFVSMPQLPAVLTLPEASVQFQDHSVGATNWFWDFGDGNISLLQSPVYIYSEPGVYSVLLTVSNDNGCVDSVLYKSIIVQDAEVILPDVITPNGDGVNDAFWVRYRGAAPVHLVIFDRWGNTVFETNDSRKAWQGRNLQGNEVVEGVYFYALTIGKQQYRGAVTLMR